MTLCPVQLSQLLLVAWNINRFPVLEKRSSDYAALVPKAQSNAPFSMQFGGAIDFAFYLDPHMMALLRVLILYAFSAFCNASMQERLSFLPMEQNFASDLHVSLPSLSQFNRNVEIMIQLKRKIQLYSSSFHDNYSPKYVPPPFSMITTSRRVKYFPQCLG